MPHFHGHPPEEGEPTPEPTQEPTPEPSPSQGPKPPAGGTETVLHSDGSRMTYDQLLSWFSTRSKKLRNRWLEDLYLAGFYRSRADMEDEYRNDELGPETIDAIDAMFTWAYTNQKAKGDKADPWSTMVGNRAKSRSEGGFSPDGGSGSGQAGPSAPQVSLTDPEALVRSLREEYKARVGKKPTNKEEQAFIALIHNAQRQQQRGVWETSRAGVASEQVGIDIAARREKFVEESRPTEVKSKELVGGASLVQQMAEGS